MRGGDDDDVVRRWTGTEWESSTPASSCPARQRTTSTSSRPRTPDNSADHHGTYTFDGSSWTIQDDAALQGEKDELPPRTVTPDGYYVLNFDKDGHPAGSVWKKTGSTWTFVTKFAVGTKSELPTDEIEKNTWFHLTEQDGSFAPGYYQRNDQHAWVAKTVTVTDADTYPPSPTTDQMFRLWEHEVTSTARAGASKSTSVGVAGARPSTSCSTSPKRSCRRGPTSR